MESYSKEKDKLKEIYRLCKSIVDLKNELNGDDHIELAEKIISIYKNK